MPQKDETKQGIWARRAAESIVDGVVTASERLPLAERSALLREIARRALWHLPNSGNEVGALVRHLNFENLRQPDRGDDLPDDLPGG